jgi:hypothetical protein
MEGYCSTGQSPQRAVVPVEEEEGALEPVAMTAELQILSLCCLGNVDF